MTSRSPSSYSDCQQVLDLALEHPGLKYRLKSHGQAINFRQRCYTLIKLHREKQEELLSLTPGAMAETIYDTLVIRQLDLAGNPNNRGTVLLFTHRELEGQIELPSQKEGTPH